MGLVQSNTTTNNNNNASDNDEISNRHSSCSPRSSVSSSSSSSRSSIIACLSLSSATQESVSANWWSSHSFERNRQHQLVAIEKTSTQPSFDKKILGILNLASCLTNEESLNKNDHGIGKTNNDIMTDTTLLFPPTCSSERVTPKTPLQQQPEQPQQQQQQPTHQHQNFRQGRFYPSHGSSRNRNTSNIGNYGHYYTRHSLHYHHHRLHQLSLLRRLNHQHHRIASTEADVSAKGKKRTKTSVHNDSTTSMITNRDNYKNKNTIVTKDEECNTVSRQDMTATMHSTTIPLNEEATPRSGSSHSSPSSNQKVKSVVIIDPKGGGKRKNDKIKEHHSQDDDYNDALEHDEKEVEMDFIKRMYDKRTWDMYHRITVARQHQQRLKQHSMIQQQQLQQEQQSIQQHQQQQLQNQNELHPHLVQTTLSTNITPYQEPIYATTTATDGYNDYQHRNGYDNRNTQNGHEMIFGDLE